MGGDDWKARRDEGERRVYKKETRRRGFERQRRTGAEGSSGERKGSRGRRSECDE